MLPLRSVGRSNFVMVCVNKFNNVDSKATYFDENCCVIYIHIQRIYTYIYIYIWQRTGGEADQHPSQLVTQSLNLHTQPHLIYEISPTCSLTSMNVCSSGFCSSVTNDCSRKPKAALPALDEPLTLQVHSGYISRTTEPIKLRDDEFYTVINLSDYSLSYFDLPVLSLGLKFTPNPPHVDRLNLKESLRRFDRNLCLREYFADSDSPVDFDTITFRKKTTWMPPPNRDKALDMFISVVESELMNAPEQKKHSKPYCR